MSWIPLWRSGRWGEELTESLVFPDHLPLQAQSRERFCSKSFMFLQGWAISDFLGNNGYSPNCNIVCFSRRFASAEANPLMEIYFFIGIVCFYRRFALGGTNLCVAWEHFCTQSFIFIDDFERQRNINPALKMVYDYAGFWNSHPFWRSRDQPKSLNRWAWKMVQQYEPFRDLRNRWIVQQCGKMAERFEKNITVNRCATPKWLNDCQCANRWTSSFNR